MTTRAAGLTDLGCRRDSNQDRILVNAQHGVFVVADGMGGEHCGELAAEIAIRSVGDYLLVNGGNSASNSAQNRVLNAVQFANQKVWEASQAYSECAGMGTTISVAVLVSDSLIIANIGDSRVYLFRDGELRRLTRDDALVSTLVDQGKISVERARAHPLRNVLTLALGRSKDINVHVNKTQLKAGDQLLVSSDGLHAVLTGTEITQIIAGPGDPDSKAQALVDAAKREGGPDNISCIVVAYQN